MAFEAPPSRALLAKSLPREPQSGPHPNGPHEKMETHRGKVTCPRSHHGP